MDALLLGMASQIAEREDHVVVEDVRGEAEAVPAGCAPLAPESRISWSSRARQVGGIQSWELALSLSAGKGSLVMAYVPLGLIGAWGMD